MKLNERGSTLVLALLAILIFTVLGISLMGNVVGEKKRSEKAESNMQSNQLAQNGLTYFEMAFKNYVEGSDPDTINIKAFLDNYNSWVPVGTEDHEEETQIKVEIHLVDEKNIIVFSKGTADSSETILKGYYSLDYDLGKTIEEIAEFPSGTIAMDFSELSVLKAGLGLGTLDILNVELLNFKGSDKRFYRVPNEAFLNISALNLLGLNLGNEKSFKTFEINRVIATRESSILGVELLKNGKGGLLSTSIKLPSSPIINETNVLIDGRYTSIELLGLNILNGYQNINFKKLAVTGNAIIREGTGWSSSANYFSFKEGLYVNKSLLIGGFHHGNLTLTGNIAVMSDLYIDDIKLNIGGNYNNAIYVLGNASINNSIIRLTSDHHNFGLFVKGKLVIANDSSNNVYHGIYYAENGIEIKTNNKPMTIKGGLIGKVTVDHPDKLTIDEDLKYLPNIKIRNIELIPIGRSIEK